jgi:hypothetical protein
MPENIREMFDVMTFYKPIGIVVEENRNIFMSILLLTVVTLIYWIISSAFLAIAYSSNFLENFLAKSWIFIGIFVFLIVQIPLSSTAVFIISRIFSSTGELKKLIAINYFLAASAGLLSFVIMIPFAEFAGAVFLAISFALYLYFTNEVFQKFFNISNLQSIILLIFYIGVPLLILAILFFASQNLKVFV